ncbi:WcaI family glycosyltransferase [Qipengyuania oceanensis]|uniref:WcaI family glycosyltransferase n=1 Tax=Qipengyuania oceanensis TaxID=1463597 RepID=UPI00301CB720
MTSARAGRILVHGINYAPETIGIGPYTAGLAQHFAAAGHAVEVVTGRPYYPAWRPADGSSALWRTSVEHGVSITRCPHYVPHQPGGVKRMLHHASFAASSALPLLRCVSRRPDIVLAIVPSLIGALPAVPAARIAGARLWVHVQDLEVDAALATGLVPHGSMSARLGLAAEQALLSRADLVTTISGQMARRIGEKGVAADRIGELRNWANHLDAINGADGAAVRKEMGLHGKFVALYSGNIGNKQGLEIVVDAARLLAARTDIAFLICGEGPNLARLVGLAGGAPNIRFEPLQSPERFAPLMRMADCHLLPQLADAADLVLPSKLANMFASGRPVVATAEQGTGVAEEVDGCGLVVSPGDAGALAAAVSSLAGNAGLARRLGEAARERARQRWTRDAVLRDADAHLSRLLAAGSGN